jgi:tRNA nucleotidyltransferase (CCA-adding enzyme)
LAEPGKFKEKLALAFTRWNTLIPITDGNKLKEMGLPPGPRYSEIIHRLRSAWIDGEITSAQQEIDLLAQLLKF